MSTRSSNASIRNLKRPPGQIESLIGDALKQIDGLQNQIQEPIRKLLEEMDHFREREIKRFQDEFDRRMKEFHELQNNILERVGLAGSSKKSDSTPKAKVDAPSKAKSGSRTKSDSRTKSGSDTKPASSSTKSATGSAKSKTTQTAAKATVAKKAGSKSSTAKSATSKTGTTKSASGNGKAAKPDDLSSIKGVGPATVKKMKDAGITTLQQIANPSADEKKKLEEFSSVRGYATWQEQARKLIS